MKIKRKNTVMMAMFFVSAILILAITVPDTLAISTVKVQKRSVETAINLSPTQSTFKAALMVGGDETDVGFSFQAIQGINALEDKYGWDISISKEVQFADQSRIAREYGDAGYDVVFAVGGQFITTTYFDVAFSYNDTLFVQVPGLNEFAPTPANVVGLHPSFQIIGHYLAGVLSGKMTETNRLGVVFGEWFEYLSLEFYAFKAGVESVNDEALVYARVAGTWSDSALGKQITETLIRTKNVDIIVQVADLTGRGVIAAAQEANIAVIGTVGDQWSLAPDITMTSIGMDTPLLMDIVAQRVINGTAMSFLGGTSWKLPIGNYLYPYHNYDDKIPQDVKDLIEATKIGIEDGSIIVPQTVTDDPPDDPIDPETSDDDGLPGFKLLELGITAMIAVPVVMRLRRRK